MSPHEREQLLSDLIEENHRIAEALAEQNRRLRRLLLGR